MHIFLFIKLDIWQRTDSNACTKEAFGNCFLNIEGIRMDLVEYVYGSLF